jgi:hypothetical protein
MSDERDTDRPAETGGVGGGSNTLNGAGTSHGRPDGGDSGADNPENTARAIEKAQLLAESDDVEREASQS